MQGDPTDNQASPGPHVTMQDIAKYCGVTKATVSRALRGDLVHVSRDTMESILRAANYLGYDPAVNFGARRLAVRKDGAQPLNHAVGFLFHYNFFQGTYFRELFTGITDVFEFEHYALVLGYAYQTASGIIMPQIFRRSEIDGLISTGDEISLQSIIKTLREQTRFHDRPIVSMIYRIHGCHCVVADDQQGGYLLGRHLLELGHRHVLHFDEPFVGYYPHELRYTGLLRAYMEEKLDTSQYLSFFSLV